jgi:adenylosuccinate lyase
LRDAADLLLVAIDELIGQLVTTAQTHRDTVMIGRTHGVHAEPTTFGAKVALWALQFDRDRTRLRAARDGISVMKLSGAVGTYSNVPPEVEAHVGAALGLQPVPATQVIARDRHAEFLWACSSIAASCELVAVELRHLQRTEVSEVREGFAPGQKGSSAMPHKRNPISAETISGLSRVVRSNLLAGLQDVALWHERDISHSSVERVILPDSSMLVHYMLRRLRRLIERLEVDAGRMEENLHSSFGVVFSQPVLLALVATGLTRDEAYRIVQRNAMLAWEQRTPFRDVLAADPEVTSREPAIDLDAAFDLRASLQHVSATIALLDDL